MTTQKNFGNVEQTSQDDLEQASSINRPVNAASNSDELIGRMMSNYAQTPFELDGLRYQSVEGFYQGLKFEDPKLRRQIAKLFGKQAKQAGNRSGGDTFTYGRKTIELGSSEHHQLVKRAIKAKFQQNPELALSLVQTYPRPIVHNVEDGPNTKLPSADFERMLIEVRQELIDTMK